MVAAHKFSGDEEADAFVIALREHVQPILKSNLGKLAGLLWTIISALVLGAFALGSTLSNLNSKLEYGKGQREVLTQELHEHEKASAESSASSAAAIAKLAGAVDQLSREVHELAERSR